MARRKTLLLRRMTCSGRPQWLVKMIALYQNDKRVLFEIWLITETMQQDVNTLR